MLSIEPLIPTTLWITLALATVALLAWYAWRRPAALTRRRWNAILSLMSVAAILVLVILLNPTWVAEIPPAPGKPRLTVMVDATASMATPDEKDGQTRYSQASKIAADLERQCAGQFDVRLETFAGTIRAATRDELSSRKPDGQWTDIAAAVTTSMDADLPQGQALVLLTDGIPTTEGGAQAVQSAASLARAANAPVYTHTLGGQGGGIDLSVELPAPQEIAFIGRKLAVHVLVRNRGVTGGDATVRLAQDGHEIAHQVVQLSARGVTQASFELQQDKPGIYPYEVSVDPIPHELTTVNNYASLLLKVVDQPVRVLLLEGKPYWDSKFLVRTLSLDPAIELHSLVKMAPGRILHRVLQRPLPSATAPAASEPSLQENWSIVSDPGELVANADALRKYQLLVLGRDTEEFLTDPALACIQNWMSRDGGSLVCYRGAPVTQVNQNLARLLPVKWTASREMRFHLQLTDQGRDLNLLNSMADGSSPLAGMPALATMDRVQHIKPLAVTLADSLASESGESPAITYQPYGSGRSVVIEGAGMWRWAFLASQYQQNDEIYGTLWHGLLRWLVSNTGLAPGEDLALRPDKVSFSVTEPATLTLLTRLEPGPGSAAKSLAVELTGTGLPAPRSFTPVPAGDDPGTYRVVLGKLPEGRYQAQVSRGPGKPSVHALFDVRLFGEEQLNLASRPDLMEQLANVSGGAVLRADDAGELKASFLAHQQRARSVRVIRAAAWDRWWILLAVFGCWGLSWGLRRSSGLI